jgi:EAL domain-containing protein (putative c-di-GMP-specific phosphodiesterase class I)
MATDDKAKIRIMRDLGAQLAGWADPGERIQQALAQDELTLFCQPIASLEGGTSFPMAEVLVRLREEEKALLPPGEFLPVFEQYGRMPDLDCWVARNVIRHISRGSRIPRFSINISSQSLADETVPKTVALELVSAGVSGTALLFEIDEADSLARLDAAKKFARGIRAVGCGLMLDGFGRRSATFSALKALQVDLVKVDGSIVRRLLTDPRAETKLKAIQKVGEALGFKLVAEMVEDQDVLLRLKALGVGFAQGFGICQPHPIELVARSGAHIAR